MRQAKDLINRALAAKTADEITLIQPWPRQDKPSMESYWDMDADELAANGWATPPFHPFCRTLLTRVDNQPDLGAQPDEQEQPQEETPPQEMRPEGQDLFNGTIDDIVVPPEQPQPEKLAPQAQAAPEQQSIQTFGHTHGGRLRRTGLGCHAAGGSDLRAAILADMAEGKPLGDLTDKLSDTDLATVTDLLDTADPGAAAALAALPIDVDDA